MNIKTGVELMYDDDGDWGMYQDATNADDEAGGLRSGEGGSTDTLLKGAAAAKRMPVNREEVVRLILQGLKDMGYRSVHLTRWVDDNAESQSIGRGPRVRIRLPSCLSAGNRF